MWYESTGSLVSKAFLREIPLFFIDVNNFIIIPTQICDFCRFILNGYLLHYNYQE